MMSSDTGVRRLLPQNTQLQSFSFAPTSFVPRENQKNYVFVDEHNRHKRLKVMRACEGCRRRKIKCDAATTNTWPCSACIRLKLHCVPPTVNYDNSSSQGFEPDRGGYESGSGDDDYHNPLSLHQHLGGPPKAPIYAQHIPFADVVNAYHSLPYTQHPQGHASMQPAMQFSHMQDAAGVIESHYPQVQTVFPVAPVPHQQAQSPEYHQDHYGQQDLVDVLGDLKVDFDGTAPYLNHKKKTQIEEPAFEDLDDYKHNLPAITSGPDLKVRIPPELMPDEETAMQYFDVYFANVHPYVPVLNKNHFYQQWQSNRESISPLILEAIFAIGGRLTDEPSEGQQWLALAGKHVDYFMDIPRLSTLQGMLILLKARESAPKRGYYYRSWMTVVQGISMAKDLGLDEHHEEHKAGKPCGSDAVDCATKTRVWEMLFVCETMIGSPQGRTGLSINTDSLEWNAPRPVPGEDAEYNVARNHFYLAKIVRNVRAMNDAYTRVKKKKKDWGMDPQLVQLGPAVEAWINDLPSDLQITFPADGSPPWLPSHFVGNLHCYYYLSIILVHRPQMNFMDPSDPDGQWKQHMMICYSSVKALCRLQEAILQYFGLVGLLSMQRGISFAIYCILTCTVLHLVAITSSDPDLNSEARDYFTRHMRILEKCSGSWSMMDMQNHIDVFREAFSADTRKPFVLKPSFPYGSPVEPGDASPSSGGQYRQSSRLIRSSSMDHLDQHHSQQQPQVSYTTHPITPPISAGGLDTKSDSPAVQSLVMMATGQRGSQPQQQQQHQHQQQNISSSVSLVDPSLNWNSYPWNNAFGPPSTQASSTSVPPPLKVPVSCSLEPITVPELQACGGVPLQQGTQPLATQQYSGAQMSSFVSPTMWQDSVANVYDVGLKRQWDYDGALGTHGTKRPR